MLLNCHQDILRLGTCGTPLVVAVGGGGSGKIDGGPGRYGGGGSGYVDHVELRINQSYVQFMANVGSAGEESIVTDISGNTTYISADSGVGSLLSLSGGRGFSGGGGCPNDGGSGGGDGQNGNNGADGGAGSGTDLSRIPIASFSLRYLYIHIY